VLRWSLALVLSTLALVAHGQAPDVERARACFGRGEAAYESGNYATALQEFQCAHDALSGDDARQSLVLYNIGSAQELLELYWEAEQSYERFILRGSDADLVEEARGRRDDIRARCALPSAPTTCLPPDRRGSAPEGEDEDDGGLGPLGVVGLVAGGVGVATMGVSLVLGLLASADYDSLTERCDASPGGGAPYTCAADLQDDIDGAARLADVSTILTFAGLGLTLAGASLLLVDLVGGDADEDPRESTLRLGPGPGQAGVSLLGTFF
jgi:tetratricopeptide (TPR) repeat protein